MGLVNRTRIAVLLTVMLMRLVGGIVSELLDCMVDPYLGLYKSQHLRWSCISGQLKSNDKALFFLKTLVIKIFIRLKKGVLWWESKVFFSRFLL